MTPSLPHDGEHERADPLPFGASWVHDLRYYTGPDGLRVAFDVGAHRGETAQLIASSFPSTEVHAFEPVRPSFNALVARTRGIRVRCVEAAVSDVDGVARFHLGPDSGRCGFRARGPGLDVRTITLDSYARTSSIQRVDLLKIDTEGHEAAVLRGALGLLRAGRVDYVLAECEFAEREDEPHGDFTEILQILVPLRYRVVSFYTGGVDNHGWRWGDVLFRRVITARRGWVVSSPRDEVPSSPPPWERS